MLITGFYAVLEQSILLSVSLTHSWHHLLLAVIALVLLVYFVDVVTDKGADRMVRLVRASPAWCAPVIKSLLIALMTAAAAILAMFSVVALMAIPALVGESAALKSAGERRADYAKGCEHSTSRCVEVARAGQPIVVGYLLESSPSHLALFDVALQRGRTLRREEAETVSTKEPVKLGGT